MSAPQAEGPVGALVDRMIRRSVRKAFRNVYWQPLSEPIQTPCILLANHHGWYDGYLMYLLATRLGIRIVDWIEEFDAFPPFAKVGGMPFPSGNAAVRGATIRRTLHLLKTGDRSLVLFGEGVLHRPPDVLPLGKTLQWLVDKAPNVTVHPVGLVYDHSLHERPEAFLKIGQALGHHTDVLQSGQAALIDLLSVIQRELGDEARWQTLHKGTPDVNERWDMRRIPGNAK